MTDVLERLRASLADHYTIEREIGSGGMATVYLAHDLKHDRKVALKVLRPELAAILGAERFLNEIKVTANLQHPHILPLFDSGRIGGWVDGRMGDSAEQPTADLPDRLSAFLYYVMPYIEGDTLRDKLNRETQLGIDEAVAITRDVADALDYAHRHNVVHRDIKPENILLHDGRPLVADFGIALAVSAAAGGRLTETGLSLGTPHYMSPEQATAEKELTSRSDIYSLGCVLYEMLTGDPPHTGASAQQIIMKIVTDEARPVTELRKSVPPHVAAAVAQALEKLPADRFASAADFAAALEGRLLTRSTARQVPVHGAGVWRWIALAAGLVAIACAALTVWTLHRTSVAPVTRVAIAFPETERPIAAPTRQFAIAPDGSRFVYQGPDGAGGHQLWVRELNALGARALPGTTGALAPFFSPDGESVAFFAGSPADLCVIAVAGGSAITVVRDSASPYGGDWGADGYLYFSNADLRIARVPAGGGIAETLSVIDTAQGHIGHDWLQLLPGGRAALVQILHLSFATIEMGVLDLATGRVTPLIHGWYGRYLPTGHLLYATTGGSLFAVAFDVGRMAVTGSPTVIAEDVHFDFNTAAAEFAFSQNGTFLYVPSGGRGSEQVVWVDRDGRQTPVDSVWRGNFEEVALSPDGSRLAVTVGVLDGEQLWVKQLPAGPLTRLTFGVGASVRPAWSPDGRRIAFVSDRSGPRLSAWVQRADGSAEAESLLAYGPGVGEIMWTPDGRSFLVRLGHGGSGVRDILAFTPGVDSVPRTVLAGPFDEVAPSISPDGEWFAYVSDESGRSEVYVRRLDDPGAGRTQVSVDGGTEPRWAHSGRELFFRSPGGEMLAAEVTLGTTFTARSPRVLFSAPNMYTDPWHTTYDITPDDRRFVMVDRAVGQSGELVLVLNWFEELKQRLRNGGRE